MNMIIKRSFFSKLFILIFPLAFFAGCEDGSSPLDFNLFAPADDVQLGQQLDQEITSKPSEYPVLNSATHTQYVQNMVNEILKSPEIKYKDVFSYKIKIINTNTINAFAAPGGYLYVYKGLLKFCDNEATLAGILAHEIAHAERRHATKRMSKQYGISMLLSVVLGDNPSMLEQIGANLLTGLALLKNSRDDEYEADEYSFLYLKSTKWYPGAIKNFFEKISAQQQSEPTKFEELLSTHPMDSKRTEQINGYLTQYSISAPTEANLFSASYQQWRNTLP
jgi:predicted Zn-dependent protease